MCIITYMIKIVKDKIREDLKKKYNDMNCVLNEKAKRLWAAAEASSIGYGGIARVMEATGMSSATINKGLKELKNKEGIDKNRIRKRGGGRKSIQNGQAKV